MCICVRACVCARLRAFVCVRACVSVCVCVCVCVCVRVCAQVHPVHTHARTHTRTRTHARILIPFEDREPTGLKMDSGRAFGSPFSSNVVVCGHCLNCVCPSHLLKH